MTYYTWSGGADGEQGIRLPSLTVHDISVLLTRELGKSGKGLK